MTTIGDREFVLREIRPEDSRNLYRWRMDDASRAMFRSTAIVPFEKHEQFLSRYFTEANDDRWFVIEVDGEPAGAVAIYDRSGTSAESGRLVIAPEHRGHGYSTRALRLLVRYAAASGFRSLHAEVLKGNDASLRAHLAAGYHETGTVSDGDREFVLVEIDLKEIN